MTLFCVIGPDLGVINCPHLLEMTAHVSKVRSLYKRILLLHRFLPIDLRALGDQYVKEEFRRHKSASPKEVSAFMVEWENYKATLQTQVLDASGRVAPRSQLGTALPEAMFQDFQNEQIGQLYELMLESTKPNRQFDIQE
uniref:Succinate dehydrogenase assembly factor 3 n=2 Tax=Gadus morhua TaxID=8049 RepID=A0A8C5CXZ6_GADMO